MMILVWIALRQRPISRMFRHRQSEGSLKPEVSRPATPVYRREPLTYRTGRTATFSVKTMPSALDAFYAIARTQGWKAGETFERAIEALQREMGQGP